jgi:hypothetical protein
MYAQRLISTVQEIFARAPTRCMLNLWSFAQCFGNTAILLAKRGWKLKMEVAVGNGGYIQSVNPIKGLNSTQLATMGASFSHQRTLSLPAPAEARCQ